MQGEDGETKQNFYGIIMDHLSEDIEKIFDKCIKKVMDPPPKALGAV